MDLEIFRWILQTECGLQSSDELVLGFSGGPDSLTLLHLLKQAGIKVIVAYFDHGLRTESAGEVRKAAEISRTCGFPFFTERGDIKALAEEQSMSIEEAAREMRYRFLFGVAVQQGARAVVVAHNADDQAETVLMHLLRGAGSRGLRGMSYRLLPNPWSKTIPVVRPLLGTWRSEVLKYCQVNDLHPVEDESNLDTKYFRNRLRHELLPILEQFAPGFKNRMNQTSEIIGSEVELLRTLSKEAWVTCLRQKASDFIQLDRIALLAQPIALQRLVICRASQELRPELRDLEYQSVQSALEIAIRKLSTPQDWVSGLCVLVEGDRLWIADWEAELPVDWPQAPEREMHIETPSGLDLAGGWKMEFREVVASTVDHKNPDPFQAWLDQDRLREELILRRRRAGDRFQPLGMETGSQKLSDFMINDKLPRRARDSWPLLCKGSDIVWVPGYRLAHPYRMKKDSRHALHVHLLQSNGRMR
jgi:tRNA(Ile)-lysidine synthase